MATVSRFAVCAAKQGRQEGESKIRPQFYGDASDSVSWHWRMPSGEQMRALSPALAEALGWSLGLAQVGGHQPARTDISSWGPGGEVEPPTAPPSWHFCLPDPNALRRLFELIQSELRRQTTAMASEELDKQILGHEVILCRETTTMGIEKPPEISAREAEMVVRRGLLGGHLPEGQERAAQALKDALSRRDMSAVAWFSACARLRAAKAAASVEVVLFGEDWPVQTVHAAMDAARAVLRPRSQEAKRVGPRLLQLADEHLERAPYAAARALMGVMVLLQQDEWHSLIDRMTRWPLKCLQLAIKVVTRQLQQSGLGEIRDTALVRQLRAEILQLLKPLKHDYHAHSLFAFADLLELMSAITTETDLSETVHLLAAAHSTGESVLKAAAASAIGYLITQYTQTASLLSQQANWERILQSAFLLRPTTQADS